MNLYNTLTKKIELVSPLKAGELKVFVCGPTVYDFVHIGNAKTYTQSDMLVRFLRYRGYKTTYLQNITDIDDKIIKRATERGVSWQDLSREFTDAYLEDMKKLNNTSVDTFVKATDHIADIILQVQTLLDKKNAYVIDDGIYFEIASFPEYGKLSGRSGLQEDDAQSRIDESEQKRGWNDFCLWKFSKADEPSWPAPFSNGRPGWHIEDTAITEHFFGPQYDIHGGAVDLIFPHHEAEITQMESASGLKPFVGHWFHVGFLTVNDKRMGKSVGNFSTLRNVFDKGYNASTIRLFFMQSHYRSSLNFTWENLDSVQNRFNNWRSIAVLRWQLDDNAVDITSDIEIALKAIVEALDDDFDTPKALSIVEQIFALAKNGIVSSSVSAFNTLIKMIDDIFYLQLEDSSQDIGDEIKASLNKRKLAREQKNWQETDKVRDSLREQNISVKDSESGQVWSYIA